MLQDHELICTIQQLVRWSRRALCKSNLSLPFCFLTWADLNQPWRQQRLKSDMFIKIQCHVFQKVHLWLLPWYEVKNAWFHSLRSDSWDVQQWCKQKNVLSSYDILRDQGAAVDLFLLVYSSLAWHMGTTLKFYVTEDQQEESHHVILTNLWPQ